MMNRDDTAYTDRIENGDDMEDGENVAYMDNMEKVSIRKRKNGEDSAWTTESIEERNSEEGVQ